jgi:hypothetical protein
MTTAGLQSGSASISLPPISSIDFHAQMAHRPEPEVVQPLPPPPPTQQRVLPPLPYPYVARPVGPPVIPSGMPPEYMQVRPIYPGIPTGYQPMPGRMALPSSSDPNLIVAPTRHKAKEVKRRTKTGCLTCRKRRIKVRILLSKSTYISIIVLSFFAVTLISLPRVTASRAGSFLCRRAVLHGRSTVGELISNPVAPNPKSWGALAHQTQALLVSEHGLIDVATPAHVSHIFPFACHPHHLPLSESIAQRHFLVSRLPLLIDALSFASPCHQNCLTTSSPH